MMDLYAALGAASCAACGENPAAGIGPAVRTWLCVECAGELSSGVQPIRSLPPSIAAGWTLGPYAGPAGAMLRRAKYAGDVRLVHTLAAWGADQLGPIDVDLVVPVPTTWWRKLWRGMNVAEVLARPVAEAAGAPLVEALRRGRGERRAQLTRRARHEGHAVPVQAAVSLSGRVLLVDDVITTGGTAGACADELLGAGAREVWLYTVAAASGGS